MCSADPGNTILYFNLFFALKYTILNLIRKENLYFDISFPGLNTFSIYIFISYHNTPLLPYIPILQQEIGVLHPIPLQLSTIYHETRLKHGLRVMPCSSTSLLALILFVCALSSHACAHAMPLSSL